MGTPPGHAAVPAACCTCRSANKRRPLPQHSCSARAREHWDSGARAAQWDLHCAVRDWPGPGCHTRRRGRLQTCAGPDGGQTGAHAEQDERRTRDLRRELAFKCLDIAQRCLSGMSLARPCLVQGPDCRCGAPGILMGRPGSEVSRTIVNAVTSTLGRWGRTGTSVRVAAAACFCNGPTADLPDSAAKSGFPR